MLLDGGRGCGHGCGLDDCGGFLGPGGQGCGRDGAFGCLGRQPLGEDAAIAGADEPDALLVEGLRLTTLIEHLNDEECGLGNAWAALALLTRLRRVSSGDGAGLCSHVGDFSCV